MAPADVPRWRRERPECAKLPQKNNKSHPKRTPKSHIVSWEPQKIYGVPQKSIGCPKTLQIPAKCTQKCQQKAQTQGSAPKSQIFLFRSHQNPPKAPKSREITPNTIITLQNSWKHPKIPLTPPQKCYQNHQNPKERQNPTELTQNYPSENPPWLPQNPNIFPQTLPIFPPKPSQSTPSLFNQNRQNSPQNPPWQRQRGTP